MKTIISAIFFLFVICFSCYSSATERDYFNSYNGFGAFLDNQNRGTSVSSSGNLIIQSMGNSPTYSLISIPQDIEDNYLKFAVRLKNTDSKNESPFGIVINYLDSLNFTELRFVKGNTDLYEPHNRRYTQIELWQHQAGNPSLVAVSDRIFKNIGHENELKTICLNYLNGDLIVQAGLSSFETYFQIPFSLNFTEKIGILSRGKIEIKNIYLDYKLLKDPIKSVIYTQSQIDSLILSSKDPIVGYWNYFDRKINSTKVQLGVKYSLAVIPAEDNDGFLILYIDNAKVNESRWKSGMIKGRLYPSGAYGNFNLVWYDADMNIMDDDCYAVLSGIDFLELIFPVDKSSFRLMKQK